MTLNKQALSMVTILFLLGVRYFDLDDLDNRYVPYQDASKYGVWRSYLENNREFSLGT